MTTPNADGWITHDGGPCPVDPEMWVEASRHGTPMEWAEAAEHRDWSRVTAYRVFAPVTPGPSPFVAETAARIMAAMAARDYRVTNMPHEWVGQAVHTAIMLEKALRDAAP